MTGGLFDNLPPRPPEGPPDSPPRRPSERAADSARVSPGSSPPNPSTSTRAAPAAPVPRADPAEPIGSPKRPAEGPWTVTTLAARVKDALSAGLPRTVRVVGEVSGLSNRSHWFFDLKDDAALVRCVMFAGQARQVRLPVRDGMEVVATGRIDYFAGRGSLQLYVTKLEPVGQGALQAEFERLAGELRAQGYFDPANKRPLPAYPQRLAVVTSRSAAALRDVIDTARQRNPGVELLHVDVRVQGDAAGPEIARALDMLSAHGRALGVDAVLLVRGGGSLEDLWAFNTREVAEAVRRCALPVATGVGHETDVTLAQLCADLGAATPTQAAMAAIPDRGELSQQVEHLAGRLSTALRRRADTASHRLARAERSQVIRNPRSWIAPQREALDRATRRLTQSLPQRVELARARLASSPARLTRALTAVTDRRQAGLRARSESLGRALRVRATTSRQSLEGQSVALHRAARTRLADGQVTSRVEP
ncbi:MAG: exodeoxyribonuclease VII large subunit [Planctomycetota bacterium]